MEVKTRKRKSARTGEVKVYRRFTHPLRFRRFAHWLVETFNLKEGSQVLDVAGGRGLLAWELVHNFGVRTHVVDPTSIRLSKSKTRFLASQSAAAPPHNFPPLSDISPKPSWFNETTLVETGVTSERVCSYLQALGLTQSQCLLEDADLDFSQYSLIVGLFPDEATEQIVNTALKCQIPFAVVPCSCKPFLMMDGSYSKLEEDASDLISILKRKDPSIKTEKLPIPAPKNSVVFCTSFNTATISTKEIRDCKKSPVVRPSNPSF